MPKRPSNVSPAEYMARYRAENFDQRAKDLAAYQGRPIGTSEQSDQQQLKLWNTRFDAPIDPLVTAPDPQTAQQLAQASGHPKPDEVLAALAAKQLDLARLLWNYPYRRELYTADGRVDDIEAQCLYSEKMAERSRTYLDEQAKQQAEPPPSTPPLPEGMHLPPPPAPPAGAVPPPEQGAPP